MTHSAGTCAIAGSRGGCVAAGSAAPRLLLAGFAATDEAAGLGLTSAPTLSA